MAFDGIVNKAICSELSGLCGARIDKIFEPNKNNVVIGMYLNGKNYALNVCTDAQRCRLHLTTHPNPNPQVAPAFCMVLRKNLCGLYLKNIYSMDLERLVIIEFEGFDDVDDILSKKLIIELMGKHSNIILVDEQNRIIDSLRHIKNIDEKYRDIIPHSLYKFPVSDKHNFLELNGFEDFYSLICENVDSFPAAVNKIIPAVFNGISKSFVNGIINVLRMDGFVVYDEVDCLDDDSVVSFFNHVYDYILNVVNLLDSDRLCFEMVYKPDGSAKDYFLRVLDSGNSEKSFALNFFVDDFYYNKESSEGFKNYRNSLLKLVLSTLHKLDKRLVNINDKLHECENMDIYKTYGELIIANLYRFNGDDNLDFIVVPNYYDDNNDIKIPLEKRYSLSVNAKRYFKKYSKLKNALEIVGKQKIETMRDLDYIQSVVYELENADSIQDLVSVYDEISENEIFQVSGSASSKSNKKSKIKKSQLTRNKNVSFNPIKYTVDGYTVLVGRNNKENDFLSLKFANKFDIWFHVKDFHGSHVILRFLDGKSRNGFSNVLDAVPMDLITKVAEIAALHSKAKNSSNVLVDYCEVRYVKKPANSKPGMVIYSNYRSVSVSL